MATDTQIAQRSAQALSRINETVRQLSEQFPSVEAPELPTRHRYPEMLALTQLTAIADFLDGLVAATETAKAKPAAKPTPDATKAKDA